MSDDNDDQVDSDINLYEGSLDGPDCMGFGPLIPTETERSLMERVREELKQELKQVKYLTFLVISLTRGLPLIRLFYIRVTRRRLLIFERKFSVREKPGNSQAIPLPS